MLKLKPAGTEAKKYILFANNMEQPNKPPQYTQGWCEFYKLKFFLTPDVLIPRPETELLVDEVIKISNHNQNLIIVDLGTGSGNIAISIAKNLPNVKIFATDISEKALEVAKKNAKFHKVEDRIIFLESDLLKEVNKAPDILVTNLPYIPSGRLPFLDSSVIDFEPKIALDGGSSGFELYRQLFYQMKQKNIFPKYLIAEIDYTHGDYLKEVQSYFPNAKVEIKLDLTQKQRILKITF